MSKKLYEMLQRRAPQLVLLPVFINLREPGQRQFSNLLPKGRDLRVHTARRL